MQNEETLLVEQLKAGEKEAFEKIYLANVELIWRSVYRIILNKQDTEEIVQETFVKAYQKINQYSFQAKFSTWLYTIAYRESLNFLKKKNRGEKNKALLKFNISTFEEDATVLETGLSKEINLALNKLNELQRMCVVLRDIESLDYQEIAERLNIKIGTVKSNLNRARFKLRNILSKSKEVL